MTQLLSEREVGGIPLMTLEMSEGEAEVLLTALAYFLSHVDHNAIEALSGALPSEVLGLRDDFQNLLQRDTSAYTIESIKEPI